MRITSWGIEYCRSIESGEIPLSDFSVLIGKNNSGKSNVLNSIIEYGKFMTSRSGGSIRNARQRLLTKVEGAHALTFVVEFELSEVEHEKMIEYLNENKGLNEHHASDCLDDGFFKRWRHEIRIGEEEMILNELASNYKDGFVTVAELEEVEQKRTKYQNLHFSELPQQVNYTRTDIGHRLPVAVIEGQLAKLHEIFLEFFESLEEISAFRNPRDRRQVRFEEELSSDASNLASILITLSQNRKPVFRKIVDTYVDVMEGVTDIRTPLLDTGSTPPETTVKIDEEGMDGAFPLAEISSGSKEILSLITKIVMAEDATSLLLVEEPELHLHPAAEQHIFDLIHETAEGDGPQVIVSTHSDVFVNQSNIDNIISVRRDHFTTLHSISGPDLSDELADLGYDSSDFVQSDAVVFVEGRSDKVIFERFAEKLSTPLEKRGVSAIVIGGDNLYADAEPILDVLGQIGIPYLFVLDSDDENPEEKRSLISSEISVNPEKIRVLNQYSIESYLITSPEAIAQAVGEEVQTIQSYLEDKPDSGNMKGVLDDLYREFLGIGYHPEKHGATIAKHIPEDDIDSEIIGLIEDIVRLAD